MGSVEIAGSKWRLVEVGRVVAVEGDHPCNGKIGAIVEIIDHKRVGFPPNQNLDLENRCKLR